MTGRFDIQDAPGRIPKATMRTCFEGAVQQTPAFTANIPLGIITINGHFSHYTDPDTDTMWLGFAIGMRCAERIAKATAGHATALDVAPAGDATLLHQSLDALTRYYGWAADIGTEEVAAAAIGALKARLGVSTPSVQTPGHPAP